MRSYQKQNGSRTSLIQPHYLDVVDWQQWLWFQMLKGHRQWKYISMMHYNDIVTYYENLFGSNNVNVLLYETLQTDKDTFAKQLGSVLNVGIDEMQLLMHSEVKENKGPTCAYKSINWRIPRAIFKVKDQQSFGEYEKELFEMFSPGNRSLMERYELPMKEYGYPI